MTVSVIYVAYATLAIDLTWIPDSAEVAIVVNGGPRPHVTPGRAVTWIEPATNIGFGAAVNLAAKRVRGDRLVLVNPDCELSAAHWPPLADSRPEAIVTIPLKSEDMNTIVASGYPTPASLVIGALRLRDRLRSRSGARFGARPAGGLRRGQSAPLRTHWVSGACTSVDRDRFLTVRGFSPEYFLYYEDVDFCARLAERYPNMIAEVADVAPGRHAVASSAAASGEIAVAARARSAATYARRGRGLRWRLAAAIIVRVARRAEYAMLTTATSPVDVVVVSLGRKSSWGERRRARSWIDIAGTAGRTAAELRLLEEVGRPRPVEALRKLVAVGRGHLVPETLAWSTQSAVSRISLLNPSVVIVLTSRAYDPRLSGGGRRLILDYVDRLSDSYRDRAGAPRTRLQARLTWQLLSRAHHRFERSRPTADLSVAAGLADAQLLGVSYVPITASVEAAEPAAAPPYDIAFVGNLRYPPNLEAVRELGALWSALLRRRPGTRLLLAGADPSPEVEALASTHGWTLLADFPDGRDVYRSTRLAVAPLAHASGMQTKIVDALSHAVPVVAYPAAAAGFDPTAPIVLVTESASLVSRVVDLLDNDRARIALGVYSAAWVRTHLDPAAWGWVVEDSAVGR